MEVSRQSVEALDEPGGAARRRTRRLMLATATRLMQEGATPSVSEVAEAADVSRATAYRYFPSQAALVEAVVDEALGPILAWDSASPDAAARVADLFARSLPRIDAFEATFRAALKLSLDDWARDKAGAPAAEPVRRGHRVSLVRQALAPLEGSFAPERVERLAQALSLVFGVEALVVLKDMWGLDATQAQSVIAWAAQMLVTGALSGEAQA